MFCVKVSYSEQVCEIAMACVCNCTHVVMSLCLSMFEFFVLLHFSIFGSLCVSVSCCGISCMPVFFCLLLLVFVFL